MPKQKSKKPSSKKPAAQKAPKPVYTTDGLTYAGASPTMRGHGKNLSAVRLDYAAATITPRDTSFVRDIRAEFGEKAKREFKRLSPKHGILDAGNLGRAYTHGFVSHIGGNLGALDCRFALTDTGYQAGKPTS